MKGTEKFWNLSNAEAMLQLLTWSLRDDGPTLKTYMSERSGCAFRKRTSPVAHPLAA